MKEEVDDRIWLLVSKKLAHEANEKELQELDYLIKENPDIQETVTIVSDFWANGGNTEPGDYSYSLFQKVKKRLK